MTVPLGLWFIYFNATFPPLSSLRYETKYAILIKYSDNQKTVEKAGAILVHLMFLQSK